MSKKMKSKRVNKRKEKKQIPKHISAISSKKKRIFTLVAILIPVLMIVLFEVILQIFKYGGNTALFVSAPNEHSIYYGINRDVCRRYFYIDTFLPSPRKDLFRKEKPKNCYRIFVLGGSTTAGFPYGNNLTFTRILNRRLSDTFPNRRIEVINTAMTAINTYTQLDFMNEILECQPDALLIYTGHNEFYGALGVASTESLGKFRSVVKLHLNLQKFKTFVLVRNTIGHIRKLFSGTSAKDVKKDPMKTAMARIVNDDSIPLDCPLYELGKKQFEKNLYEILKKAKRAGVPVLISELVSNVRDHKPFASVNSNTLPSAQTVFQKAQALEKSGEYHKAREAYYLAKDLDALRFRASEEFNEIIHSLAAEYNIPVVPMKLYFENASPNGLIGNNLMHEHLHPNVDGYFLMAEAFYNTMQREKFINPNWHTRFIKPNSFYRQNWGFTKLDSVYAALTITHLKGGWPFKTGGPNLSLYKYTPSTKEDSIALHILKTGEATLELGHIELTKHFKRKGELESAFNEYKALIYTVPYLDLFYEPTVNLLIETNQYERLLQILYEALKFNESFFIYKWLGTMSLTLNYTQRGILYLEHARKFEQEDTDLLFNLTRAYYKTSQFNKGDNILSQLKRIAPNSQAIVTLEEYKQSISKERITS